MEYTRPSLRQPYTRIRVTTCVEIMEIGEVSLEINLYVVLAINPLLA